jgi:glycosyltransferase involved in cell wall biosynthesis
MSHACYGLVPVNAQHLSAGVARGRGHAVNPDDSCATQNMSASGVQPRSPSRICLVGPGAHFLSGVSYYTQRLAFALAGRHRLSVVLLRRLMPLRWYPGQAHVGADLGAVRYPTEAEIYDGVDWFWGGSIRHAIYMICHQRPDVVVLEWWTGTVLHTLLALAWLARRVGARVIIEFHEVQDTGELRVPLAGRYVDALFPLLLRLVDGAVVHSEHDRHAVQDRFGLGDRPLVTIPHGPHRVLPAVPHRTSDTDDECRLLYFGVIRPFKGVEDLIRAFDSLPPENAAGLRLMIVGETWEGHTLPLEMVDASRYRDRIDVINRYVTDAEVADFFATADVVVLPYHRSSASGPLHLAMSTGLPVVVTAVGGLIEAVQDYGGAILVPPQDVDELARALLKACTMRNQRFADPHSWERTIDRFAELFAAVRA